MSNKIPPGLPPALIPKPSHKSYGTKISIPEMDIDRPDKLSEVVNKTLNK